MNSEITPDQLASWKIVLALRLRTANGDAFQDFFADVMRACHGENFVPIRAHGALGDKGCDGYTQSDGRVFQCYGALNATIKVTSFTKKMTEDFEKAKTKLSSIMKCWSMAHNLEGLPIDVLTHFESMKKNNEKFDLRMFGRASFEEVIFELPLHKIETLLGRALALKGDRDLNIMALRDLISRIVEAAEDPEPPRGDPIPVPVNKMEFNNIPPHWQRSLSSHMDLAPFVKEYFDHHVDPTIGDQVGKVLNNRYNELKAQGLSPGAILESLLESVVHSGSGVPKHATDQAGLTILAHFFDSCGIFEDHPSKVPA